MQAAAPPSANPLPLPRDKKTLAAYITEAALLEQQFMCQYLYAAFSLKKQADHTCTPAQIEVVRRWASHIYTIARQEMEHLSIANSLLTAIGSPPWFGHTNFPTQSRWYQASALRHKKGSINGPDPCDFPFLLQAFDLSVAQRFCCMESPTLDYVPSQDREKVLEWCFENSSGACGCMPELPEPPPEALSFVASPAPSSNEVAPGTVQELYEAISRGLEYLNEELGSKALFSGHQSGQSQIPSEYDIYLFSICDLDTALAGVRLITRQGEGIDAPPGYDSHFQNYYDIAVEFEALRAQDPAFQPAHPLPLNPKIEQYDIPITKEAVLAFNDGYVAMLYMLTAYYGNYRTAVYNKPPYLLQALEQTVFAPTMTMLVRSLAELITGLPADQSGAPAGPVFDLTPEVLARLSNPADPIFLDINFHTSNLKAVAKKLKRIVNEEDPPPALKPKFQYVHQNVKRMIGNLQYIYENGIYPKFLNIPPCAQEESCD